MGNIALVAVHLHAVGWSKIDGDEFGCVRLT